MRQEATVGGITLIVERNQPIGDTVDDRVTVAVFVDGKAKFTAKINGQQWHDFVKAERLLGMVLSGELGA